MWFQITRSAESLWWWSAGALLLLSAATAVVYLLDQRQIDRMSVWAKPVKFQLSLAVHFATLALVTTALGNAWRTADLLWWSAVASVASAVFEIGYIMVQAGRAQGSHFNVRNRFYAAMYVLMAVGAVIITIAAASVGIAAWADTSAAMGSAARCGAALGLIGGTVLTFIVAFRMGGALTHHVGTEVVGARRLPLTGWSLTVGDWRVPHFFATHLMQRPRVCPLAPSMGLRRISPAIPSGIFVEPVTRR